MKKFLVALVALVATAAMVAPAFAEDRLSLGGEMRVRAWHVDAGGPTTDTWADQRLRIGGKLTIADGVSVTFRTDVTESQWGTRPEGNGSGRQANFPSQQWDRAHLDLTKGIFHLRAGQQFVKLGNSGLDIQSNGLLVDLKVGPGQVTAFSMLDDQNGQYGDGFLSGVKYGMKNFSVFVANENSWADEQEDAYVAGATLNLDLGALAVNGEVEQFFGDADATHDAVGTQITAGVDFKASDIVTVGGAAYYALSNDDTANDTRYTIFGTEFDGWDPLLDVGTGLSNEEIAVGNAFGLFNDAGVIALQAKAIVKPLDALKVGASVTYAMPEDDKIVVDTTTGNTYDSAVLLAGGLSYALMDNTSLDLQVQYFIIDDLLNSDDVLSVGTGLFVAF